MLVLSVALNIGLISTFAYFVLSESQLSVTTVPEIQPSQPSLPPATNQQVLAQYCRASVHKLLSLLHNQELLEQGYTKRDLALACLVSIYHFNLEGALGQPPEQKRIYTLIHPEINKEITISLYPGLSDFHFQAILHFAKTEQWPFTTYGLFSLIQRMHPFPEPSLIEAFSLTAECRAISTLFAKSGMQIETSALVQMLSQGSWDLITSFYTQQKLLPDLTPNRRRCFILEYLEAGSSLAARILIEADSQFAAKRLSDQHILSLFDLYPQPSPYLESFAEVLLSSPRSDAVWQKAADKLGKEILSKHAPTKEAPKTEQSSYTVQDGDSLWIIARKLGITVDTLLESNELEGEMIHPGQTLQIPKMH
jgi:hypothetical protein